MILTKFVSRLLLGNYILCEGFSVPWHRSFILQLHSFCRLFMFATAGNLIIVLCCVRR